MSAGAGFFDRELLAYLEAQELSYSIFVTNRPDLPEEIWRDYNQRACIEQRIEELKSDLAADDFCLKQFYATEADFLAILMLFNLLAEFQRASAMPGYRQPACGCSSSNGGDSRPPRASHGAPSVLSMGRSRKA